MLWVGLDSALWVLSLSGQTWDGLGALGSVVVGATWHGLGTLGSVVVGATWDGLGTLGSVLVGATWAGLDSFSWAGLRLHLWLRQYWAFGARVPS